jgi:glycosyltransferase involved in cell wall biosynthesis
MNRKTRATVVIASQDRPEELRQCLNSVLRSVTSEDEVIVVDSASADPDAVSAVASTAGVRLIRSERAGSARARNIGVRHSRGEIVAFTDDDARVDPGWLDALVDGFSNPSVGAVVGPVFEIGSNPPVLLLNFAYFDAATDAVTFNRMQDDWFARVRFGAIGSGANLAVRRNVFERQGLFRESLGRGAPIGGDENYFLLTIIEGEETVVNEPSARVYHPLQPPKRFEELERCGIAYLLYVAINRPRLRARLIKSIVLRRLRRARSLPNALASGPGLVKALLSAPALLMAARRIDRGR